MKAYVIGSSQDLEEVQSLMKELKELGLSIVHDWTECFKIEPKDFYLFAQQDVQGVEEADIIIFLCERKLPYCGSWSEFGMAILLDKPIFALGKEVHRNIFSRLDNVFIYESKVTMLKHIKNFKQIKEALENDTN